MIGRSLTIKQKLRYIVMTTVGAALILACAAMLAYDYFAARSSMRNDLGILAQIFGSNSTAALSFRDQKATEEILAALKSKPHIVGACIYEADRRLFTVYRRATESKEFRAPAFPADGSRFESGRLMLLQRISLRGEIIGAIYLESDLDEIWSHFW